MALESQKSPIFKEHLWTLFWTYNVFELKLLKPKFFGCKFIINADSFWTWYFSAPNYFLTHHLLWGKKNGWILDFNHNWSLMQYGPKYTLEWCWPNLFLTLRGKFFLTRKLHSKFFIVIENTINTFRFFNKKGGMTHPTQSLWL